MVLWLAGFAVCLAIPLWARRDIPANWAILAREGFETFGPGLAVMLAFIFSDQKANTTRRRRRSLVDLVAILIGCLYVGTFVILMLAFQMRWQRADETVGNFQVLRPYLSVLTTGMITYYFGVARQKPASA